MIHVTFTRLSLWPLRPWTCVRVFWNVLSLNFLHTIFFAEFFPHSLSMEPSILRFFQSIYGLCSFWDLKATDMHTERQADRHLHFFPCSIRRKTKVDNFHETNTFLQERQKKRQEREPGYSWIWKGCLLS